MQGLSWPSRQGACTNPQKLRRCRQCYEPSGSGCDTIGVSRQARERGEEEARERARRETRESSTRGQRTDKTEARSQEKGGTTAGREAKERRRRRGQDRGPGPPKEEKRQQEDPTQTDNPIQERDERHLEGGSTLSLQVVLQSYQKLLHQLGTLLESLRILAQANDVLLNGGKGEIGGLRSSIFLI